MTDLPLADGGVQRLLYAAPDNPRAALIMLPGANGMVEIGQDGTIRRMGQNFLLRTRPLWQSHGLTVVVITPPNGMSLLGHRHTPAYAATIGQAVDFVRSRTNVPVWLVGTSQGATAAVNGGAQLGGKVAGIVVASAVTGRNSSGETLFDSEPGIGHGAGPDRRKYWRHLPREPTGRRDEDRCRAHPRSTQGNRVHAERRDRGATLRGDGAARLLRDRGSDGGAYRSVDQRTDRAVTAGPCGRAVRHCLGARVDPSDNESEIHKKEGVQVMPAAPSLAETITVLAGPFSGQLLQPADAGYDEARRVHNGLIDKRPALIARCRGVADVVDAVLLARSLGLEVAVRGGGHNVAGRATVDGGLMIDLSLMRAIYVDPAHRTARVQGGATWAEVNRETQLHGLAVTGGVVSTTGVAGLTLGGGIGWLMSKYGLALDNLRSVELVTASGEVLHAGRAGAIPTCSGRCVAAAATSAWQPRSSSICIRSARP